MAISSSKRTSEWAAKPWGAEEIGGSHSLFPHLPLISCFACHSHVTSLREIALRLLRLSICERWLHHHHNSSLNSKCTRTPESICEVLTSPMAFDIWAKADKIAQTPWTWSRRDLKTHEVTGGEWQYKRWKKSPLLFLYISLQKDHSSLMYWSKLCKAWVRSRK